MNEASFAWLPAASFSTKSGISLPCLVAVEHAGFGLGPLGRGGFGRLRLRLGRGFPIARPQYQRQAKDGESERSGKQQERLQCNVGTLREGPSAIMREINASIPFDKALWRQDIAASKAHVAMLGAQGIVSAEDAALIADGLDKVAAEYEANGVPENWDLEDIHMTTENALPN